MGALSPSLVWSSLQGLFSSDDRADVLNKDASKFCFSSRKRTVAELLDFAAERVEKLFSGNFRG